MKILVLFCTLILSFSLFADDDNYKYEDNHIHKSLEHLNLNTQQLEKIKKILTANKKDFETFYENKEEYEKKLKSIMRNETFDKKLYITTKQEISKKAIELEALTLKKIHEVLNNKQRKRFSHYLKEWRFE